MKLIDELIEFCLRRNMLSEENKRKLQEDGFYTFYYEDASPYTPDLIYKREKELYERELALEEQALENRLVDRSVPHSHSSDRRHGKSKSAPAKPKLTGEDLDQRVQEEWNDFTKRCPWFMRFLSSWNIGRLTQVVADGFTLNDVYTLLGLEFRDYSLDFSGPAPAAYRQLRRHQGSIPVRYAWLMKYPAIARMAQFGAFQQQIHQEVKTLYETQRETFARLSSQNGKLTFPSWEKAVQTDTTSMKVWTILDLPSAPVTPERIEEVLTWTPALALAMQIDFDFVTKLVTRDWSCLIVITERKIENAILKSVVIPEGVTEIRDDAFRDCRSLTSVVIPEGVKEIGSDAFRDCRSLTSVVIPKGVKEIGSDAFRDCRSLTSVVIPEGVTEIGLDAFYSCSSLTSVEIPEGVTEIGGGAFLGCSSLTSMVIHEGVTVIGWNAFSGCRSLTSVVIPEGVMEIGDWAFSDCSSLTSVVIPEGVTVIGNWAFAGCSSLTSVEIPEGVTEIGVDAFIRVRKLTIHASAGSYAEKYAKENGIPFETLEKEK